MSLRTCKWEKTGSRCLWPAEVQRRIPGRERLKTYPVCRWHSAMIDVGDVGRDSADVDGHLPDDFVRTSALVIEAAEDITRQESGAPGTDPDGTE